jgi:hypothetical protein
VVAMRRRVLGMLDRKGARSKSWRFTRAEVSRLKVAGAAPARVEAWEAAQWPANGRRWLVVEGVPYVRPRGGVPLERVKKRPVPRGTPRVVCALCLTPLTKRNEGDHVHVTHGKFDGCLAELARRIVARDPGPWKKRGG